MEAAVACWTPDTESVQPVPMRERAYPRSSGALEFFLQACQEVSLFTQIPYVSSVEDIDVIVVPPPPPPPEDDERSSVLFDLAVEPATPKSQGRTTLRDLWIQNRIKRLENKTNLENASMSGLASVNSESARTLRTGHPSTTPDAIKRNTSSTISDTRNPPSSPSRHADSQQRERSHEKNAPGLPPTRTSGNSSAKNSDDNKVDDSSVTGNIKRKTPGTPPRNNKERPLMGTPPRHIDKKNVSGTPPKSKESKINSLDGSQWKRMNLFSRGRSNRHPSTKIFKASTHQLIEI